MGSYAGHVSSAGVIADKDHAVKSLVNALHHHQRSRPGADYGDVLWELLNQQVLAVAVRVAYDDLGGTRLESGLGSCFHLFGHELSKAIVLKTLWSELVAGDNADYAFH